MLKERLAAAKRVETALLAAEQAAENTFQSTVALLEAMNTARVTANLEPRTGRIETSHVSNAIQLAGALREHIFEAHAALAATRTSVLPIFAVGDNGSCPGGTGTTSAELVRLVG